MLKQFRTQHLKTILWVLLVMIVPSFVFWSVASYQKSKKENAMFELDGKILDIAQFRTYMTTAQLYYLLFAANRPDANITGPMVETKALEMLLYNWKAKKEGIEVTDKEIIDVIAQSERFASGGTFDKRIYNEFVSRLGLSARVFEEHIRKILITEKVLDTFVRNVEVPDEEIRALFAKEKDTVSLTYIYIPFSQYADTVTVSDEEIRTYYQTHTNEFIKSESETPRPFEEVKMTITEKLNSEKTKDFCRSLSEELLKEAKASNQNLSQFASTKGLKAKSLDMVTASEAQAELGLLQDIGEPLSSLLENQIIESVIGANEGYYLIALTKREPFAEELFQKEKETYRARLKAGKVFSAYLEFLTALNEEAGLKKLQ